MKRHLIVAALAVGAATGCSTRLTEFTALSTKNVAIKGDRAPQRTTGISCDRWITFIPIGFANMKDAIDRAIESAGPGYDALEDGVMSVSALPLIVYSQRCIEVTGTAIKTKAAPGATNLMKHSSTEEPLAAR